MPLTMRRRGNLGTAFVLLLVVSLFVFAIYLKASPSTDSPVSGGSPSQIKFWVKNSASQNTKVKLATVETFILLLAVVLSPIQSRGSSQQAPPTPILPLKDDFIESGHWFRPPPLS